VLASVASAPPKKLPEMWIRRCFARIQAIETAKFLTSKSWSWENEFQVGQNDIMEGGIVFILSKIDAITYSINLEVVVNSHIMWLDGLIQVVTSHLDYW